MVLKMFIKIDCKGVNKIMKKKISKKLMIVMIGLFMVSGVFALWVLQNFNGITGYTIRSDEPITFTTDFTTDAIIDTTNSNQTVTETVTFHNANGEKEYLIYYNKTFVDNSTDTCDPASSDSIIEVVYNNNTISYSGENVSIPSGDTVLEVSLTALKHSCPSYLSAEIDLIPN